jgi:hypothetical protein
VHKPCFASEGVVRWRDQRCLVGGLGGLFRSLIGHFIPHDASVGLDFEDARVYATFSPAEDEFSSAPCKFGVNIHGACEHGLWVVDHFLEPLNGDLAVSEDQGLLCGGADVIEYVIHGCRFCSVDCVGGAVPVGLYEERLLIAGSPDCGAHHLAEVLVLDDTTIGEVCLFPGVFGAHWVVASVGQDGASGERAVLCK